MAAHFGPLISRKQTTPAPFLAQPTGKFDTPSKRGLTPQALAASFFTHNADPNLKKWVYSPLLFVPGMISDT